jgi:hypothetical protein
VLEAAQTQRRPIKYQQFRQFKETVQVGPGASAGGADWRWWCEIGGGGGVWCWVVVVKLKITFRGGK